MPCLGKDIQEMTNNMMNKAALTIADQALPFNFFSQPGIQFLLSEIADFKKETNSSAFKALLKKLASDKAIINRADDLSDRFTKVSKF